MKKRLAIITLLVLTLTLFAFPVPASAATREVGTGKTYETIQDAIDAADAGDTILVYDGTYTANVDVNKRLTIQSVNGYNSTTVAAAGSSDHVFEVTTDYVTISGFTIYGGTGSNKAGIYITADNSTISNNRSGYDATHKNNLGIWLFGVGHTVSDNTCSSNVFSGIRLGYSSNSTISGNTSNSNGYHGIFLDNSSNNTVLGNTCSSNSRYGIHLNYSNNNNVSGNTCSLNSISGITLLVSSNNTVSGNNCSNSNSTGIVLGTSSNNNIISGNTCSSNSNSGIDLQVNSSNNIIYLNNFSNNTAANVYSSNSTNTWKSPTTLCYFYASSHKNYLGNYYSDRGGNDNDNDGIGSETYTTDGDNDQYPLWQTSDHYTVQAWYLHSDSTMYQADMGKGPGTVTVNGEASNTWIGDEATPSDATFSSDTWTGQVVFDSAPTGGHTFTVEIGYSTDGDDFTADGPEATLTGDGSAKAFTYTTDVTSVTVPSGKYLALRITNNNSGSDYSVVTGGAWSYTSNPDTGAPNYPVPELATIILLGSGLAGLGGYLIVRSRKKSSQRV